MAVSDSKPPAPALADTSLHVTAFTVLFAISFCHLLNDMMQSLLSALYPDLKARLELNFEQVGLITMTYQVTASILQPVVGLISDKRPMPYSLPVAMVANLIGLLLLAVSHVYGLLLFAAALLGVGSAIFHPESSRVAHMASGGRHGLAQSLFQVGGNFGQALGPLMAAAIVINFGQGSIAWFAVIALMAILILWHVGTWYKHHGITRIANTKRTHDLPPSRVRLAILVLLVLMFSKQVYLASIGSYYTFFLIHRFGVSLQTAQVMLFLFLGAVGVGTMAGGLIGDRFGRRYVIWFSILGTLPFTLMLPYADLFWTCALSVVIGLVLASALPAILVYAHELMPGRIGMISGLFFGTAFGLSGFGAAALGWLADRTSIETVYIVCSALPALGLFAAFLPDLKTH